MDTGIESAIIAAGTALAVVGVSEGIKAIVRHRTAETQQEQTRLMVRSLYRSALRQLNGVMKLGYVDEPGRFEATLRALTERVARDDIAAAFKPKQADLIYRSMTALLDGLHGTLRAHEDYRSSGSPDLPEAVEWYANRVRESAGVAMALTMIVLQDMGDGDFAQKNISRINLHRILEFMEQEKELQAVENPRDAELIKTKYGAAKDAAKKPPESSRETHGKMPD